MEKQRGPKGGQLGRKKLPEVFRTIRKRRSPKFADSKEGKEYHEWGLEKTVYAAHGERRPRWKGREIKTHQWTQTMAQWEKKLYLTAVPFGQLQRVVKKCGGLLIFAVLVETYPRTIAVSWPKTFKGLIPTACLINLILRARHFGILLTVADIYPDIVRHDVCLGKSIVAREPMVKWHRFQENKKLYDNFLRDITFSG